MDKPRIASGLPALDQVVEGLRLGDNVVWQIDELADYVHFARPFVEQSLKDGIRCVYVRFAPHDPVVPTVPGLAVVRVDPRQGFDSFSREIHRVIEQEGREVHYVFDNLSVLAVEWATDELVANFFQITCPYLFELDTVAYFSVTRQQHANSALARIRDTTQVLFDVFHAEGQMYLHPIKVWNRYSPQMFLPHAVAEDTLTPIFSSGLAAAVSGTARKNPLKQQTISSAPWARVYEKLLQYRAVALDSGREFPEILSLKEELSRILLGSQPQTQELAKEYLTVDDLIGVRERVVGSGRVGGKAAGMILARAVLRSATGDEAEAMLPEVLEEHDSFFIGSDVFYSFLVHNDLTRLRWDFSQSSTLSREEFAEIEKRFLAGRFPSAIVEQFEDLLDYYGQAPIIVRSSSLLEDGFGNAFAGKYRSEFCANQGSPPDRLEAFMDAVKLVYASCLNPDALAYRRKRDLMDKDEQMAILVQRVSGMPYKRFFFPSLAGVAFSRNLYAWTDAIDPRQGLVRMVFGLGTRAVDRVGSDYPRMFSISDPMLRPEFGMQVRKYSQRLVDVIDLEANGMKTLPLREVLQDRDYPRLPLFVSLLREGYLWDLTFGFGNEPMVLTFNNLLQNTEFAGLLGTMLQRLDNAYGGPVDTEFTAAVDGDGRIKINLLQCRPLFIPSTTESAALTDGAEPKQVLFRTMRAIPGTDTANIRYIFYVDPQAYHRAPVDMKRSLRGIAAQVNGIEEITSAGILLVGPGRWGSSNIDLGVSVSYADINHARALVELAVGSSDSVPELSYGTHFFQDLVEDGIGYLPVYPGDAGAVFDEEFFSQAPSVLGRWVPNEETYQEVVKLIDVFELTEGKAVRLAMELGSLKGICYLEEA